MSGEITANEMRGRAIGALFFTGFGGLWLVLALYAREQLSVVSGALVSGGAATLVSGAVWLISKASGLRKVDECPAMRRAFGWINLGQWIAIALVAFSFARLHIDAYVMSAITAIVGLHMLPLARLFRYKPHYVTGTVLVSWAAVSIFLLPVDRLQGGTALGTGAILWSSAFFTLILAMGRLRLQPELVKG
jgi:hypothetical protein